MSPARKVYILGVWLAKILIIFLSLMGIFSILKQIGFISPRQADRQVIEEVAEGSMVAVAINVVCLDIPGLEIQRLFYLFKVYFIRRKKMESIPIIFWFSFFFGVQKICFF